MTQFLHGVETIELPSRQPITGVRTAVIGLVGTAPMHLVDAANQSVDVPQLCLNAADDAKYFGPDTAGYTIPTALKAIRAQEKLGAGAIVFVINTFDPATHYTAASAEAHALVAGVLTLSHQPIKGTLVVKDSTDATTYVEGTDYTVDYVADTITRISTGAIGSATATLHATYHYPNPVAVTGTTVIGSTSGGGVRSGLQAFLNCRGLFGYVPRLLIAPGFSTAATVVSALSTMNALLRACSFMDAPPGTSVQVALAGRGPSGSINFFTSDDRTVPCFPYVKATMADGTIGLQPLSQFAAGVTAVKDTTNGYWWSPSNTNIQGIFGTEIPLTFALNDPNCEVNQLNGAGIMTVMSDAGTGYRLWGNRNASFPTSTAPESFISLRRVRDVLQDSVEYAMLNRADMPTNWAFIDQVSEDVNRFIRTLIGRGALINGRCWADPADNPVDQLGQGEVVWSYDFMGPPPCERMTFKSSTNLDYLKQLLGGNS